MAVLLLIRSCWNRRLGDYKRHQPRQAAERNARSAHLTVSLLDCCEQQSSSSWSVHSATCSAQHDLDLTPQQLRESVRQIDSCMRYLNICWTTTLLHSVSSEDKKALQRVLSRHICKYRVENDIWSVTGLYKTYGLKNRPAQYSFALSRSNTVTDDLDNAQL